MNIQVISGPDGTIPWTSGAVPGRTHDLTAARVWGILRELDNAGIITLADKGYQGAEAPIVFSPYKGRNKPESQKQANRSHAKLHGPGERANAQLKSWKLLRKLRMRSRRLWMISMRRASGAGRPAGRGSGCRLL
jgi:hypothetical protein